MKIQSLLCLLLISLSGTLYAADYYVDDATGHDTADGRSPQTAWQTLDQVNRASLAGGDSVRFKKGGLWRGYLDLQDGVLYTFWGEGAKPRIYGSVSLNREEDWEASENGIWLSRESLTLTGDVGNIILDGSRAAVKKWTPADVTQEDEFWFDIVGDKRIRYKSSVNPATRFHEMEAALGTHHVVDHSFSTGATVDGFDIRYGAAHGFGGTRARSLTIRNCDISWIGGADQYREGGQGRRVRFGNGIEFWNTAENCLVENNRLWEIYDAALTNQGNGTNVERNLIWRGNEIWNSEYSYEYWNHPEDSLTENILFENNTCRDAGYGWGHSQRPDPNGGHLMFYNNSAKTSNIRIIHNTFSRSTEVLVRMENDWRSALTFENNQWEQVPDRAWFRLFQKKFGPEGQEQLTAPQPGPETEK